MSTYNGGFGSYSCSQLLGVLTSQLGAAHGPPSGVIILGGTWQFVFTFEACTEQPPKGAPGQMGPCVLDEKKLPKGSNVVLFWEVYDHP